MIARRWAGIALIIMLLFLAFGCGREKPKSSFDLGKEHFRASNYTKAMIRLETWIQTNPNSIEAVEAHAMLAVIYRNDETRQPQFENEMKKLMQTGESAAVAVLELRRNNPTIGSRLGNTIDYILVRAGGLSVAPLIKDLTGPNPRLRRNALRVLMQIGEPAVDPLILLLDDSDLYNRSRAVEALNKIGDKRAIEPLKKKLNDPSKLVQVEVAAALHGMGQMNPTDVILSALEDANIQTRRAAAKAVWEIIDDPPQKLVLKAMKDADPDVRNYATLAIGKKPTPEIVNPLIKTLKEDENDQVKSSAAKSLEKVGKPAVEPLIKLLENTKDVKRTIRIVQILGNIGDKRAIKPMEKIYNEAIVPLLKDETAKALNKID